MFTLCHGIMRHDYIALRCKVGSGPQPNPLNLCFTGLFTDPAGAACGQRAQALQFQALYPGSDFILWSWAQDGAGNVISSIADAVKECEQLYTIMLAGNYNGPYTHFLADGHSFGGSFCHFFIWWLSKWHPEITISLARFLDAVPNPYDGNPWFLPMAHVTRAMQWTQHNGMGWFEPIGPNGSPLEPDDPTRTIESVDFPFGTANMSHCALVADPRVWTPSLAAMRAAVGGTP
jgi:hypothetical protein